MGTILIAGECGLHALIATVARISQVLFVGYATEQGK
jgi:hypothetical protein